MTLSASHGIDEAAAIIVGTDANGDPLPGAVEWVERRLRSGKFSGYKAARRWRMTDADITAAIDSLRPHRSTSSRPAAVVVDITPDVDRPLLSSMTRTSRRRLAVGS